MKLLPFDTLPAHKPRRLLPAAIDLGDWSQIRPLFDQLEQRAARCTSAADLESWLLDWSELSAALDEESSKRYIAMTCHTDDAGAEKAYLHFVEHIEPQLKPRQFELAKIYIAHRLRPQLASPRFHVFDRDTKNQVDLFRPESVPLETEEAKLSQQYQKLSGSLTVRFRGEEKTLVQMGRYLEEPDRVLRKEAWNWWPTAASRKRISSRRSSIKCSSCAGRSRHRPGSRTTGTTPSGGWAASIICRPTANSFTTRSSGRSCRGARIAGGTAPAAQARHAASVGSGGGPVEPARR